MKYNPLESQPGLVPPMGFNKSVRKFKKRVDMILSGNRVSVYQGWTPCRPGRDSMWPTITLIPWPHSSVPLYTPPHLHLSKITNLRIPPPPQAWLNPHGSACSDWKVVHHWSTHMELRQWALALRFVSTGHSLSAVVTLKPLDSHLRSHSPSLISHRLGSIASFSGFSLTYCLALVFTSLYQFLNSISHLLRNVKDRK